VLQENDLRAAGKPLEVLAVVLAMLFQELLHEDGDILRIRNGIRLKLYGPCQSSDRIRRCEQSGGAVASNRLLTCHPHPVD
jgi:hypothetical protein